ncbi:MAG: DMT family transporter [Roseivirga sp.]
MHKKKVENSLLNWIVLILLALLGGSSYILMKKGLVVYSSQEIGALRIFFAGVSLLPLSVPQLRQLSGRQHRWLLLIGLTGALFPALLFAQAQEHLSSALNGALSSSIPILTLLAGKLFFQQPISVSNMVGATIGIIGTILLIFAGSTQDIAQVSYQALFPLLGCFFLGIHANLTKYYLTDLSPYVVTSVSFFAVSVAAGGILLGQSGLISKIQTAEGAYLALGYVLVLGVLCSAGAYLLLTSLVKCTSPIFASMAAFLMPIVALAWGLLDGEVLLWGHYVGMGMIFLGVHLVNKQ